MTEENKKNDDADIKSTLPEFVVKAKIDITQEKADENAKKEEHKDIPEADKLNSTEPIIDKKIEAEEIKANQPKIEEDKSKNENNPRENEIEPEKVSPH